MPDIADDFTILGFWAANVTRQTPSRNVGPSETLLTRPSL